MERNQRITYWEEARTLANIACWSIELQVKRLRRNEPEIPEFVMQPVADLRFLVTSVANLRKAADLACQASDIAREIEEFDRAVPDWRRIRNAFEHIDEYWQQKGRDKTLKPGDLATITFGPVIEWAGMRLDPQMTMTAAHNLFLAIKAIWPLTDDEN
jgi:hypothetical protein